MTAAIASEWARLLLGSLVQCGVRDVVISPGSRSTPFAWAAAHTTGLACHALYDERSAAFFALGMARVKGEPALLLCTSGSAAANYFPAVVEASLAAVPLLVMTADRPLELKDAGAPQTIDQVKLYGDFAKGFFDLGVPDAAPLSLAALKRVATQAVFATQSPVPGPVHVNARARKPLEPAPARTEHELAVVAEVDRLLGRGVARPFAPLRSPSPRGIEELARRLAAAERGVIVCGPLGLGPGGARDALVSLANRLAMPIFAEATSQLRFEGAIGEPLSVDAFDWVFRSPRARKALRPDFVLRFGATPASAGLEALLGERGPTELAVVTERGFSDPTNSATLFVFGDAASVASSLGTELADHVPSAAQKGYAERCGRANQAAWSAVESVLGDATFEQAAEALSIRRAVHAVPSGGLLVLGNSLPVREVDAFVRASGRGIKVVSQRGANGIDGVVSGAAGAAFKSGVPTLLLVGDVSFAHDLSGLAAARRVRTPLTLVVLDNGGGRIFEQLPVQRLLAAEPHASDLWLTPPGLAFELATRAFGLPYASASSEKELEGALEAAAGRSGASVVHVTIAPESTLKTFHAVSELVEARLAALGGSEAG